MKNIIIYTIATIPFAFIGASILLAAFAHYFG